jgi:hypothetical protein
MSRYVINLGENKEFIYGWDHALGYFYELWDNNISDKEELCLITERCSLFDRMPSYEIIEQMEKYGAKREHIESVASDLPL